MKEVYASIPNDKGVLTSNKTFIFRAAPCIGTSFMKLGISIHSYFVGSWYKITFSQKAFCCRRTHETS